ncbi:MAG TPA: hypothetical protein VFS00_29720 [Polyangiaceae bacterium]|nr:hypothetical protein [Polyangiaceae bacterium]
MATDPVEQLSQEFQDISAVYEQEFAGQSRQTRDVQRLESLMGQLRGLIARLERASAAFSSEALGRLRSEALESLSMYENERKAIAEAKALGPQYAEFMLLATLANQVFARYGRNFAGHSRQTRDLGLLDEMIADLRALRQRMRDVMKKKDHPAFQRDVDLVGQQLDLYVREREAIAAAQREGTPDERAGLLATLANAQFDLYRTHFAGRSRATRRPGLLQRIVEQLRQLRAGMIELERAGLASEANQRNIEVVAQNLNSYEIEVAEIKAARQGAPMRDLTSMLGGAANEVFEQYRAGFAGRPRNEVDLPLLGTLCDLLGEIARQMADFHRVNKDEINAKNLDIVNTQLSSYEREFVLVLEAQRSAATGA